MREEKPSENDQLLGLAAVLSTLKTMTDTKHKEDFLVDTLKRDWWLEKWFRYALDPYVHFHLTSKQALELKRVQGDKSHTVLSLLKQLSNRQLNGTTELAAANWYTCVKDLGKEIRRTANRVLDKNLKAGVGPKLINKVFARLKLELIQDWRVALGKQYSGEKVWEQGLWYASKRIRGDRCLAILEEGKDAELFNQFGKPIENEQIRDELMEYDGKWKLPSLVFDGKLIPGTEDYEPCYYVFDLIPLKTFKRGSGKREFSKRHSKLTEVLWTIGSEYVKGVKQEPIESRQDFAKLKIKAKDREWPGIVLRRNGPYVGQLTDDILEVML